MGCGRPWGYWPAAGGGLSCPDAVPLSRHHHWPAAAAAEEAVVLEQPAVAGRYLHHPLAGVVVVVVASPGLQAWALGSC